MNNLNYSLKLLILMNAEVDKFDLLTSMYESMKIHFYQWVLDFEYSCRGGSLV